MMKGTKFIRAYVCKNLRTAMYMSCATERIPYTVLPSSPAASVSLYGLFGCGTVLPYTLHPPVHFLSLFCRHRCWSDRCAFFFHVHSGNYTANMLFSKYLTMMSHVDHDLRIVGELPKALLWSQLDSLLDNLLL